jgi:flagellar biosynthesis/type III secretory pathway chaperone
MTELRRLQDERRDLLRAGGYPLTPQGIEHMLLDAGAARSEANAWRDCADRTNRCRELNDRNAALVAARLRRVEGMLDVLVGTRDYGSGYTRDAALGGTQAGRLLATEA